MFRHQTSARYLVDFGEHGTLLSQPLIVPPSMDSHSIQTDEKDLAVDRGLAAPADREKTVIVTAAPPPAETSSSEDTQQRQSASCVRADRCYNTTLICLAVLLVVVAAIALPLWLVPSGTGQYTNYTCSTSFRKHRTHARRNLHLFA